MRGSVNAFKATSLLGCGGTQPPRPTFENERDIRHLHFLRVVILATNAEPSPWYV